MDTLLTVTASDWLARLGWALLHFVWQGAAIGLCYAVLTPLFRHAGAQARYLLALTTLLLLGSCVPITLWFLADAATVTGPSGLGVAGGSIAAVGTAIGPPASELEIVLAWLGNLAPWIVPAWAIGVALLSSRLFLDWYRVRTVVAEAQAVADPLWAGVLERVSGAVGLKRAVQLLESASTEVPVVVGWLRPVVLVPSSVLFGLDPRQLELILIHELAHVRRGDYLINLLQVAIETLLFYHPVVRWISGRVREERENCCDDLVVRTSGDRLAYARALLELEGLRGLAASAAMSSAGGNLAVRIRRIIGMPAPQKGVADWLTGVALTALGVASLGIGAIDDPSQPSARPAGERHEIGSGPPAPAPEPKASAIREEFADPAVPQPVIGSLEAEGAPGTIVPASAAMNPPAGAAGATARLEASPSADREPGQSAVVAAARSSGSTAAPVEVAETAPERPANAAPEPVDVPTPSPLAELDLEYERLSPPAVVAKSRVQSEAPPSGPGSGPRIDTGSSVASAPEEPVVTGGQPVRMAAPEFPSRARSLGHEGYVVVAFTIGTNGRPRDIEVVDVGPRDYFSKAAIRAIRQWRFEPIRVDGEVVEKRKTQRFSFVLDGSEPVAEEDCVLLTGSRLCR